MKHLLPFILLAATAVPSWGDTVDFRTYGDIARNVGSGVSGTMYGAAVRVDEATAEAFRGCSLDSITVGFGKGSKRDITLFLTYDLSEEPFMICKSKLKGYNQVNRFPLDTPYVLDGKPFYIGYRYTCIGQNAEPIAFDGDTKYSNPGGAWICTAEDESGLLEGWENYAPYYGNLTIGCTLTGDLPEVYLYPVKLEYADFCAPRQEFPVNVTLRNFGSADATAATAAFSIDGAEPTVVETYPGENIPAGEEGVMAFRCISETVGIDIPLSLNVDKVGDKANPGARILANTFTCSDDVFKRAVVFEEYTGIHCGNCPVGIVAFEYLNEHFDFEHDGIITIAAHQYSTGDPMYCPSYQDWLLGMGMFSAPNSVANRTEFSYPSTNRLLEVYKNMRKWSKGKISIDWEYTDDTRSAIDVTTTTLFSESQDDTDYAVALALVEDNVRPFPQTNYFDNDIALPEFYGKGDPVKMMFNDVARYINCWNGAEESVLTSVEAHKEYSYSEQLSLKPCNQPFNTRLVAMLIDRRSNEIVNADMVSLKVYDAVETVAAETVKVSAGPGAIILGGSGEADVYTVDGRRLGTFAAPCRIPAASGIHIVAPRQGQPPVKLIVK